MNRLATHMRIANLSVSNEEIREREQAISTLLTAWKSLDQPGQLIDKAADIASCLHGDGTPSVLLGQEVEAAIQVNGPAYVYMERPLDVGVCAALVAMDMVSALEDRTGTSPLDLFAAALWSALAYQAPLVEIRREALRGELLSACRDRCISAANAARERYDVDEFDEDETYEDIDAVKDVACSAVASLKQNALLDREELNFLWWVLLQRSRLLNKPLEKIAEPVRLLACAIEGATYLTALPAEAHRDMVLRTLDADPKLNHKGLLKAIGSDREALAVAYSAANIVTRLPTVFPVLHSLSADISGNEGIATVRSSSEWAMRTFLEAAIVKLYHSSTVVS
ncbi:MULTISPECIES: GTPase-associated system all-helical protein GASH [Achromobacter]|uniref:GTPase-associated system all-helical protein GASH n=1 Tax=Achromobacter spanius TaxID=217203 RepID=A0ABY8GS99_9BURK|nr:MULTISPECIES: GTPase-associated system all-helical protein GASH [Achromobacter]WAI83049.1 hypothetical protein N8Z00_26705 [Achromobacter spanius]WEX93134.1 hypothetical protein N3Z32_21300 [Achromobacter sp. SS2-2022]WFP07710.1 GTPase-associated system all-helical protein GASH [Achromobacter spanius]